MKVIAALFFIVLPSIALTADPSPYVGEEFRQITSLSEGEIDSLRNGNGMGFAKLAELNHFPGPKHVLDMADELNLTQFQVDASRLLYQEMLNQAILHGETLLEAETRLDRAFEDESVTAQSLETSLLRIGSIRAQLRYVHLEAHLRQRRILTADQISAYDAIRGYHSTENGEVTHSRSHHK